MKKALFTSVESKIEIKLATTQGFVLLAYAKLKSQNYDKWLLESKLEQSESGSASMLTVKPINTGLFDISLSQTKPEKVISAKSIHCNYIELKEIRRKSFKKHDDL